MGGEVEDFVTSPGRIVQAAFTGGQSEIARQVERGARRVGVTGTGQTQALRAQEEALRQQEQQAASLEAEARSEAERQRLVAARRSRGRASTILTGGSGIAAGSQRIGTQRLLGS